MSKSRSARDLYLDAEIGDALSELEEDSGSDFVAARMGLCKGGRVDLLRYKHDNYEVYMTGIADDVESKRKETRNWIDIMLEAGFPNTTRSLKATSFTNKDFDNPVEYGSGYRFSSDLGENERLEVEAAFRDVFCPSPFEQNYSRL